MSACFNNLAERPRGQGCPRSFLSQPRPQAPFRTNPIDSQCQLYILSRMSPFSRWQIAVLAALVSCGLLQAKPPVILGDPPPAPTPEEVARLPRRGLAKHGPVGSFVVTTTRREEARNFFNSVFA